MKPYEKPELYFSTDNKEFKKLEILDFSEIKPVCECDDFFLSLSDTSFEMQFELKYFDLNMKMTLLGKEYWRGKVPKIYKGKNMKEAVT